MKNRTKILLASLILIVSGFLITVIAVFSGGKPGFSITRKGLQSVDEIFSGQYALEKTKIESFRNADIDLDYVDFSILPSDDYYLEYRLSQNSKVMAYSVENNTFSFQENKTGTDSFEINFFSFYPFTESKDYYVTLYVPKDVYFTQFSLQSNCGDVWIESLNADSLTLNMDYGNLTLGSFNGKSFDLSLDSGSLYAKQITSDTFHASDAYGDLTIDEFTGKDAEITLDSGSLVIDNMNVTNLTAQNAYGNIKMTSLLPLAEYDLDLRTEFGEINATTYFASDSSQITSTAGKGKSISAYCDSGDVDLFEISRKAK